MPKRGKQGVDRTRLRIGQVEPGNGGDTGGGEFPGVDDLGAGPRPPAGGGGLPAINIQNIATATAIAINEQGEGDVGDVTVPPPTGTPPPGKPDDPGMMMMMMDPGMMMPPQMASPGQGGIVGMNPPGMQMQMGPRRAGTYRF